MESASSALSKSASSKSASSKSALSKSATKLLSKANKTNDIYTKALLTKRIKLPISAISNNIKQLLEENIKNNIENRCIVEGYIKNNSVVVSGYSSGIISGSDIIFDAEFECDICLPVEGMQFSCRVKDITKAGIRAVSHEDPTPFIIFIARDHHNTSSDFSLVNKDDTIIAKIIGQRFELNDSYISIIAELVTSKVKPKLTITD